MDDFLATILAFFGFPGISLGLLGLFFLDHLKKPLRAIILIGAFIISALASFQMIQIFGIYFAMACVPIPFLPLIFKRNKNDTKD